MALPQFYQREEAQRTHGTFNPVSGANWLHQPYFRKRKVLMHQVHRLEVGELET
jgi:hypothetical protein